MTQNITPQPLTASAFAPFGDVIEAAGPVDMIINEGMCDRFHDRAKLAFSGGRAGISMFRARPRSLPLTLDLVERHPLGSQAFIPMTQTSFLVVVAEDDRGEPVRLQAFLTTPGQSINFHRGTWHGVLTPLADPGLFAVVDRIGDGNNLEEYRFKTPFTVIEHG